MDRENLNMKPVESTVSVFRRPAIDLRDLRMPGIVFVILAAAGAIGGFFHRLLSKK